MFIGICSIKGLSFERTENCRVYNKFYGPDLASFGQLGFISDPQMSSKLQNGINDPKGLENKIYTMMKSRETFYGDHTVPVTSCSEVQYVLLKGDPFTVEKISNSVRTRSARSVGQRLNQ